MCSAAPSRLARPRFSCCSQQGSASVGTETNLWLIRHAPVDGLRGVIRMAPMRRPISAMPRRPSSAALRARLPANGACAAFAARRGEPAQTARSRLGSIQSDEVAFAANRIFGDCDRAAPRRSRRRSPAAAYQRSSGNRRRSNSRPPGGERFADQIDRTRGRARNGLPAGDVVLVGAFRHHPRGARHRTRSRAWTPRCASVIDPLSLTRIDRLANGWRIVAVNQH